MKSEKNFKNGRLEYMQHIDADLQKKAWPAYNGLNRSDHGFLKFLHDF